MKTPEEIKKGLKRHLCNDDVDCVSICYKDGCPYLDDAKNGELTCGQLICNDTIVYIQQLEATISQVSKSLCGKENATLEEILQEVSQVKSRLAQVERERDALMCDLKTAIYRGRSFNLDCELCKDKAKPICEDCDWEWRGVCEENTKEDGNA